jgi:hypothetical protein
MGFHKKMKEIEQKAPKYKFLRISYSNIKDTTKKYQGQAFQILGLPHYKQATHKNSLSYNGFRQKLFCCIGKYFCPLALTFLGFFLLVGAYLITSAMYGDFKSDWNQINSFWSIIVAFFGTATFLWGFLWALFLALFGSLSLYLATKPDAENYEVWGFVFFMVIGFFVCYFILRILGLDWIINVFWSQL